MAKQGRCYVYRIFDGHETVYIGKGTGRRLQAQKRRFGCDGEILERDLTDDAAFKRERELIAQYMPTANRCPGGGGGRSVRKIIKIPAWLVREQREMERLGTRRYVAQFLLTKIDERNCEQFGRSKVDVNRWREVANGQRL